MVVIVADIKPGKISLMFLTHLANHLLRRDAKLLGLKHNRRAVGIVGADEVDVVAAHSLVTNPDISLDMLQHVAEVDRAIRIGKGAGYQYFFRGLSHSENYIFLVKRGFDITKWAIIW